MKQQPHWSEDDRQSKEGTCNVCTSCRIHIASGRCMYGGPFEWYTIYRADPPKDLQHLVS
jgi:hypothetical protein